MKRFVIYLLTLPVITFVVFIFLSNSVYHYYLTHLNIAYILIFTYLLFIAFTKKLVAVAVVLSFCFTANLTLGLYNSVRISLHDYPDYGSVHKMRGKKDALDFIFKDAGKTEFGLLVFSPPVYTYPYDYLVWWYAREKYGYVPYNDKKGTFYLLMEPDPSKPTSYIGWLETVIKDGEVVFEKKLPSGFIIQKREL
jgi:hypothetical protein